MSFLIVLVKKGRCHQNSLLLRMTELLHMCTYVHMWKLFLALWIDFLTILLNCRYQGVCRNI